LKFEDECISVIEGKEGGVMEHETLSKQSV